MKRILFLFCLAVMVLSGDLLAQGGKTFPDFEEETNPVGEDIVLIWDGVRNKKVKLSEIVTEQAVNPGNLATTLAADGLGLDIGGRLYIKTEGPYFEIDGDNIDITDQSLDSSLYGLQSIYVRHLSDSVLSLFFQTGETVQINEGDSLLFGTNSEIFAFFIGDSLNYQFSNTRKIVYSSKPIGPGFIYKYQEITPYGVISYYSGAEKLRTTNYGIDVTGSARLTDTLFFDDADYINWTGSRMKLTSSQGFDVDEIAVTGNVIYLGAEADGNYLYKTGSDTLFYHKASGQDFNLLSQGTGGSSDTQVLFNNGGAVDGSSALTFNGSILATQFLNATLGVSSGGNIACDPAGYYSWTTDPDTKIEHGTNTVYHVAGDDTTMIVTAGNVTIDDTLTVLGKLFATTDTAHFYYLKIDDSYPSSSYGLMYYNDGTWYIDNDYGDINMQANTFMNLAVNGFITLNAGQYITLIADSVNTNGKLTSDYYLGQLYTDDGSVTVSTTPINTYRTITGFTTDISENLTLTDSTITIPADGSGYYEVSQSCSYIHSNSTVLCHISLFVDDIEDTRNETERKIGTGSDEGDQGRPSLTWLSGGEVIKFKAKADKTGTLTVNHGTIIVKRIN